MRTVRLQPAGVTVQASPLRGDASSSPSKQSRCPSPTASVCTHTPLWQWKPLFLQPSNHRGLSGGQGKGQKVTSCLLWQHISSLRSPQSSTPSQVWSRDTRLPLTQTKRLSSSERAKGQRSRWRRRRRRPAHRCGPGTRRNRKPWRPCGRRCGCCCRSHTRPANSRNPGNGR